MKICLLNDSFPPKIDGVANTVLNYAKILTDRGHEVIVATPSYPGVNDEYPFRVVRYLSLDTQKLVGYRTGYPFSAKAIDEIRDFAPDIIHSHCPFVSSILARNLREVTGAPIVFTYHTKFDIDLQSLFSAKLIQSGAVKIIVENISACDAVWAVSNGAADNLRGLGYMGAVKIVNNGVDMTPESSPDERVNALAEEYKLNRDLPTYLFVGRLQWYKGIRIILNSLSELYKSGKRFNMIFVGNGAERPEMEKYAEDLGIRDMCIFTGPIYDREKLRDFYTMADLFLFPSTFDTNGLVVREAAACGTASALIEGSCAAEGISDGVDGFLFRENSSYKNGLYGLLRKTYGNRELLSEAGERARQNIYSSWEESLNTVIPEYERIIRDVPPKLREVHDGGDLLIQAASDIYMGLSRLRQRRDDIKQSIAERRDDVKEKFEEIADDASENYENLVRAIEAHFSEVKDFIDRYM